ncbi:hypothetical protein EKO04_007699 [Ascochyta lentis]|uniref:Metallo-beta-lactamase domain-containing protein n=1 Tax=Ascochyta lentis TaxID=205686 RepID=A0A8H7J2Y4_9PLEO|nr:hypothetical protein EKO04_007699 [Ascochyta lentis]
MARTTLEWFGMTTFRLRTGGVTVFLDTWLDRPSVLPKYMAVSDVAEADYIFISHAHFDHLPGADRIAIRTGAIVVASCEAVNLLRLAGVPEEQLLPVSGGERIPLFRRTVRDQAKRGEVPTAASLPGQPKMPHHSLASLSVHVWPSLHAFLPKPHPEVMDTRVVYTGETTPYTCTLDITHGMKYGLLQLDKLVPQEKMSESMHSFLDYVSDRKTNVFSHCDGGLLMFNIIIDGNGLLWNAHLGAYEGIMSRIKPKPKIAILGVAGRANHDGRPFDGSAAEFAVKEIRWLDQPETVIWCMHDESCIAPYRVDITGAMNSLERETTSKVLTLAPGEQTNLEI